MTNNNPWKMKLGEKWKSQTYTNHRAELKRRGITVEQAIERGYEPLTVKETWAAINQGVGETIAFTCLKPDGTPQPERRYCLISPAERVRCGRKYTQRAGAGVVTYTRRPKKPNKKLKKHRVLTEGEFKADAIAEVLGVIAISVPGVDCFKKDGLLHPDLANLDWDGYTAELAFDVDEKPKTRIHVISRLLELADLLAARCATIKIRDMPRVPNLPKAAADDAIQYLRERRVPERAAP